MGNVIIEKKNILLFGGCKGEPAPTPSADASDEKKKKYLVSTPKVPCGHASKHFGQSRLSGRKVKFICTLPAVRD